ncbi:hypothetical protein [Gorillibacterium sp. CAU 1737]|uniref:hypothetical protein n=1 Tax=Gorillibacterium sp. CAU 1737 TaxID=3140362 RepID=UPI0032600023
MKRKLLSITLALSLLPTFSYAESKSYEAQEKKQLSQQELRVLTDEVGFTKEDFEAVPVEVARDLIEQKARKISNGVVQSYTMEKNDQPSTVIAPMSFDAADINLYGNAYLTQGTDKPGFKRILMVASFQWQSQPRYKYTDKMSIGYPSTNKFIFNTSNGKIQGHTNRSYFYFEDNLLNFESNTPTDADPGAGVAADYYYHPFAEKLNGSIIQYVYVPDNQSGTSNVCIRYGHKYLTLGSPSVSIYPYGLSVTPSTTVQTADYILTLTW